MNYITVLIYDEQNRKTPPLRKFMGEVKGVNAKVAIAVTNGLGTMAIAWLFSFLSLSSLPATLYAAHIIPALGLITATGFILCIAWISQNFIQLVALSVLQVSNNASAAQSEHETQMLLEGINNTNNSLDISTEGGIKALQDNLDEELDAIKKQIAENKST
jgi:hypothetical protein